MKHQKRVIRILCMVILATSLFVKVAPIHAQAQANNCASTSLSDAGDMLLQVALAAAEELPGIGIGVKAFNELLAQAEDGKLEKTMTCAVHQEFVQQHTNELNAVLAGLGEAFNDDSMDLDGLERDARNAAKMFKPGETLEQFALAAYAHIDTLIVMAFRSMEEGDSDTAQNKVKSIHEFSAQYHDAVDSEVSKYRNSFTIEKIIFPGQTIEHGIRVSAETKWYVSSSYLGSSDYFDTNKEAEDFVWEKRWGHLLNDKFPNVNSILSGLSNIDQRWQETEAKLKTEEDPCVEDDSCAEPDPSDPEDPCTEDDSCAEPDPSDPEDPCTEDDSCPQEDPRSQDDSCVEDDSCSQEDSNAQEESCIEDDSCF